MGFTVVGLGLFGLSLFFFLMTLGQEPDVTDAFGSEYGKDSSVLANSVDYLAGFGFGASSIALFARVAGGIYTKAADVGADLVESYVGSLIAAATLAVSQSKLESSVIHEQAEEAIALAFMLPAIGIICSIVGFFFVSTKEEGKGWD